MKNWKLVASVVIAVLVIVIALQNTDEVETHILFAKVTMSRALLIAVTFSAGALAGLAAGLWIARSRRVAAKPSRKGVEG